MDHIKISGVFAAGKPVTLKLNGATVATKTADQYGYYEFNNLLAAKYEVWTAAGVAAADTTSGSLAHISTFAGQQSSAPSSSSSGAASGSGESPAFTAVGACLKFGDLDGGWAQEATDLGLTYVRSFAQSLQKGGKLDGSFFNPIKRAAQKYPKLKFIGMHSVSEPSGGFGARLDPAKTPTLDDWQAYFAALAQVIKGYEDRYYVELANEPNFPHYLNFGQDGTKVSSKVVDYVTAYAQIARKALGSNVYLIGPSVGYSGVWQCSVEYAKAYKAAGLLGVVDAYNDHLYPPSVDVLQKQLDGVRGVIGDKTWFATETQLTKLNISNYAAQAPAYLNLMRKAKIIPCVYRLMPRHDNELDGISLCDDKGNKRPAVCAAWGLK